jgi:hypothetical protein
MRRLLYALTVAGCVPLFAACEQTVQQEAKDVKEAHDAAASNVAEEQKDVEKAAIEGAKDVVKEQRDVEDAAREGTKNIIEEKRELEDAKAREAERDATAPPSTTPPNP